MIKKVHILALLWLVAMLDAVSAIKPAQGAASQEAAAGKRRRKKRRKQSKSSNTGEGQPRSRSPFQRLGSALSSLTRSLSRSKPSDPERASIGQRQRPTIQHPDFKPNYPEVYRPQPRNPTQFDPTTSVPQSQRFYKPRQRSATVGDITQTGEGPSSSFLQDIQKLKQKIRQGSLVRSVVMLSGNKQQTLRNLSEFPGLKELIVGKTPTQTSGSAGATAEYYTDSDFDSSGAESELEGAGAGTGDSTSIQDLGESSATGVRGESSLPLPMSQGLPQRRDSQSSSSDQFQEDTPSGSPSQQTQTEAFPYDQSGTQRAYLQDQGASGGDQQQQYWPDPPQTEKQRIYDDVHEPKEEAADPQAGQQRSRLPPDASQKMLDFSGQLEKALRQRASSLSLSERSLSIGSKGSRRQSSDISSLPRSIKKPSGPPPSPPTFPPFPPFKPPTRSQRQLPRPPPPTKKKPPAPAPPSAATQILSPPSAQETAKPADPIDKPKRQALLPPPKVKSATKQQFVPDQQKLSSGHDDEIVQHVGPDVVTPWKSPLPEGWKQLAFDLRSVKLKPLQHVSLIQRPIGTKLTGTVKTTARQTTAGTTKTTGASTTTTETSKATGPSTTTTTTSTLTPKQPRAALIPLIQRPISSVSSVPALTPSDTLVRTASKPPPLKPKPSFIPKTFTKQASAQFHFPSPPTSLIMGYDQFTFQPIQSAPSDQGEILPLPPSFMSQEQQFPTLPLPPPPVFPKPLFTPQPFITTKPTLKPFTKPPPIVQSSGSFKSLFQSRLLQVSKSLQPQLKRPSFKESRLTEGTSGRSEVEKSSTGGPKTQPSTEAKTEQPTSGRTSRTSARQRRESVIRPTDVAAARDEFKLLDTTRLLESKRGVIKQSRLSTYQNPYPTLRGSIPPSTHLPSQFKNRYVSFIKTLAAVSQGKSTANHMQRLVAMDQVHRFLFQLTAQEKIMIDGVFQQKARTGGQTIPTLSYIEDMINQASQTQSQRTQGYLTPTQITQLSIDLIKWRYGEGEAKGKLPIIPSCNQVSLARIELACRLPATKIYQKQLKNRVTLSQETVQTSKSLLKQVMEAKGLKQAHQVRVKLAKILKGLKLQQHQFLSFQLNGDTKQLLLDLQASIVKTSRYFSQLESSKNN